MEATTRTTSSWRWVYQLAAVAAIVNVIVIIVQIVAFSISQPPDTIQEWFALFDRNPVMAMINLDLIYLFNNMLIIPMYFALYLALRQKQEGTALFALIVGMIGLAAYMPSNTAFEMQRLHAQYVTASADQQALLLAAGQALIVKYYGSSFIAYYVLNAVSLLFFANAMRRSPIFGKNVAWAGLIAGVLMVVPSPFGIIGLIFAFASLFPWSIFSVLLARRFLQMASET